MITQATCPARYSCEEWNRSQGSGLISTQCFVMKALKRREMFIRSQGLLPFREHTVFILHNHRAVRKIVRKLSEIKLMASLVLSSGNAPLSVGKENYTGRSLSSSITWLNSAPIPCPLASIMRTCLLKRTSLAHNQNLLTQGNFFSP